MRPDQHKKKKNQQYKKKHGISGTKQKNDSTEIKGSKNKPPTSSDEHSAKQLPEETGETSRIFRRRHMESNWSRYEGLEESLEENVEIRGIDFEKVTKVAGNIGIHFDFKSDKSWTSDLDSQSETNELISKYLTLDVDNLAASMRCIPLHKKLGLEQTLFTEEMLEQFQMESDANKRLLSGVATQHKKDKENKSNHAGDTEINSEKSETAATAQCDVLDELLDSCVDVINTNRTELAANKKETPCIHPIRAEVDLDELLGLKDDVHSKLDVQNDSANTQTGCSNVMKQICHSTTPVSSLKSKSVLIAADTTDDDWLDSVLDS